MPHHPDRHRRCQTEERTGIAKQGEGCARVLRVFEPQETRHHLDQPPGEVSGGPPLADEVDHEHRRADEGSDGQRLAAHFTHRVA